MVRSGSLRRHPLSGRDRSVRAGWQMNSARRRVRRECSTPLHVYAFEAGAGRRGEVVDAARGHGGLPTRAGRVPTDEDRACRAPDRCRPADRRCIGSGTPAGHRQPHDRVRVHAGRGNLRAGREPLRLVLPSSLHRRSAGALDSASAPVTWPRGGTWRPSSRLIRATASSIVAQWSRISHPGRRPLRVQGVKAVVQTAESQ